MDIQLLRDIGLSSGEIKVYLALLELGSSSIGAIAKTAKVSPSKTYVILDKLITKGLVGYIQQGRTKYFEAANPGRLIGYLESKKSRITEQQEELNKIIPELLNKHQKDTCAFLYQGVESIKNMYNEIYNELSPGDEYIAYGITGSASLRNANAFFQEWQVKRGKKGIKAKLLYEYSAKDIAEKRLQAKLTEIRIMPKEFKTPAGINVYGNKIAIILWIDTPLLFIIDNPEVADSFRQYFKLLWGMAGK